VIQKLRGDACIGVILAFALCAPPALAAGEPPADLARRAARRETATENARNQYTYRQSVVLEEYAERGGTGGQYREVRDVIFTPAGERTEKLVGTPLVNLRRLVLTPEDFRDIREIQPLVLTSEMLHLYETRFRGEEKMDDVDCWVLEARPRQILSGQRLFEGLLWIARQDYSIVRMEGRAVPQIRTLKSENLFPRFTTLRRPVDGEHWFPVHTFADDVLEFRTGGVRIRLNIRYSEYKRFGAESTVRFGDPK
jgi:hypothetical protein